MNRSIGLEWKDEKQRRGSEEERGTGHLTFRVYFFFSVFGLKLSEAQSVCYPSTIYMSHPLLTAFIFSSGLRCNSPSDLLICTPHVLFFFLAFLFYLFQFF